MTKEAHRKRRAIDEEWRERDKARVKRWQIENREYRLQLEKGRRMAAEIEDGGARFREVKLKKCFGIDLKEYQRILDSQGGVCGICHQPERSIDQRNKRPFSLAVDHDHVTGQVRGLLCAGCNKGLGMFKDNEALLLRAAAYVAEFLARTVPACHVGSDGLCH